MDVNIDYARSMGHKDESGQYPPDSYFNYEEYLNFPGAKWTRWMNNYDFFDQTLL